MEKLIITDSDSSGRGDNNIDDDGHYLGCSYSDGFGYGGSFNACRLGSGHGYGYGNGYSNGGGKGSGNYYIFLGDGNESENYYVFHGDGNGDGYSDIFVNQDGSK